MSTTVALVLIALMCCITIIVCRKIQVASYQKTLDYDREIYERENPPPPKKRFSPYSLRRTMHSGTQKWGYCIMDGNDVYLSANGYYEVIYDINQAIEILWTLEDIGRYERTEFGKLQNDPGTS